MKKNQKGITIISLVITIIVLSIIAGVSIGSLTNNKKIIETAEEAKQSDDIAREKEIINLAGVIAKNNSSKGELTEKNFTQEINNQADGREVSIEYDSTNKKFTVTFKDTNRSYEVDKEGNIL